jgi:hypothetical protein
MAANPSMIFGYKTVACIYIWNIFRNPITSSINTFNHSTRFGATDSTDPKCIVIGILEFVISKHIHLQWFRYIKLSRGSTINSFKTIAPVALFQHNRFHQCKTSTKAFCVSTHIDELPVAPLSTDFIMYAGENKRRNHRC